MNYEERLIYLIRSLVEQDSMQCSFIKRTDGSLREMHCYLRSPESDRPDLGLIAVWDRVKQADRMIPLESMVRISVGDSVITPDVDGNFLTENHIRRIERALAAISKPRANGPKTPRPGVKKPPKRGS